MQFTEIIKDNERLSHFQVWYDITEDKFYCLKVFNKEMQLNLEWYLNDSDFHQVTDVLRDLISSVAHERAA